MNCLSHCIERNLNDYLQFQFNLHKHLSGQCPNDRIPVLVYMHTYFGSVILNKYVFGGAFPKPDFLWQTHVYCSHSKWFQNVSDLLGGVPLFSIDVSVGPYRDLKPHALEYVVNQMHEGIEWLEKVMGRRYEEIFIFKKERG